ncbi:MAG TPA: hypothetical protein VLA93_08365 [Pyrinomonadaceae bacterium]|nr:hypothetical protein [Pyrinomonadaceae bacterium]
MLFHLSEEAGIEKFDPRPSEYTADRVVWAISADRMCNYLVPRDCPRVTYYAGRNTTSADVERFLGKSQKVVAVENGWLARIRSCRLFCYGLAPETFECLDECAGYFVSRVSVVPQQVEVFDDLIGELQKRGVELRLMEELWGLRDEVVGSTLQFSLIRMHNAAGRVQV